MSSLAEKLLSIVLPRVTAAAQTCYEFFCLECTLGLSNPCCCTDPDCNGITCAEPCQPC